MVPSRIAVGVVAAALALLPTVLHSMGGRSGGASANTRLHQGTLYLSEDGATLSDIDVRGNIVVRAKNVTISNVRLVSTTPWHAIEVKEGATGFTLRDSEIDGGGTTVNAVLGFGRYLHNHIRGVENGINVTGPSEIRNNYIHDLRGGNNAHFDGIEINGGDDITIVHNTIVNSNSQTSAVMLDNYFSGLSKITVEDNILIGGGYTVYLDGRFDGGPVDNASIRIVNNRIGGAAWGNFALFGNTPVLDGNVDLPKPIQAISPDRW